MALQPCVLAKTFSRARQLRQPAKLQFVLVLSISNSEIWANTKIEGKCSIKIPGHWSIITA
jgi:hypothetical protein